MIRKLPDYPGRLNAFQRVMYQWSALHPYNATHTYQIAGPLQLERLCDAIRATYARHRMGIVHISSDRLSYRHEVDDSPEVQVLQGGEDPSSRLAEHTTRELNRPFERPSFRPLRFSVMDAGPKAHYVTTTYDHWVADSVAARLVMRHVLGRYCGLEIPENREPIDLYPGTYRDVLGHRLRGLSLVAATARALRHGNRNRWAWQVAYSSTSQMAVQHELYSTAPGTVLRLCEFAHSLGATVNDVILAALGIAMAEFMPRRSCRGKRRDLAMGSIVDSRPDAISDLSQTFGTFLAYYLVRCAPDQGANLAEMSRRVASITGPIKARKGYLDSVVNMKFINAVWPHLSDTVKVHFMRKLLPMTAGVSNVLLRDPWINRNRQCILGYSRGSPTGPNVPLVLAPTTLGESMNIGVTYRITGFSRAKIDGIMEMFLDQIQNPRQFRPVHRRQGGKQHSVTAVNPTFAQPRLVTSGSAS
jgi:hypothetical protein